MVNKSELIPVDKGDIIDITPNLPSSLETKLDHDLVYARDNMEEMAKIGIQAVADLASVCGQSGDRVDYEKLAILMKAIAEVHKDFIAVSREIDIIAKPPEPPEEKSGGNITNNLVVGSTSEMVELLKQLKG